jgi:ribosomal protein S18 acetylase RimI-like enzyme
VFSLRPLQASDREFSYRVYADARRQELAVLDWPPAQKEAFLRMQFEVRERQYRADYADADWQAILHDGVPAGTMITRKAADAVYLVDIALLAEHRRSGIGTAILKSLQQKGQKIILHVQRQNPAVSLYSGLGFAPVAEDPMYLRMEWNPR